MDCLFCKIISKQLLARVIYEDSETVGMLDVHPRAPGHTMVVPKVHTPTLLELPPAKIGPVFHAVQIVARRLKDVLHCDGFTVGINQGRAGGQMVDHMHIHLLPRWHDDGGSSIHAVVNNPPQESLELLAERLKF